MKKSLFGYDVRQTDETMHSMQSQIDVLTAKLTNLSAELSAKMLEISEAPTATEDDGKKYALLNTKIADLTKENKKLAADNEDLNTQLDDLDEENEKFQNKLKDIYEENKSLKKQLETKEVSASADNSPLEAEIKSLKDEIEDLNSQLDELDEDNEKLRAIAVESKELKKQLEAAKSSSDNDETLSQYRENISALKAENTRLKSLVDEQEKKLSELQRQLKSSSARSEEEIERKLEHVGSIYLKAYEDAERIKNEAVEKLNDNVCGGIENAKNIKLRLLESTESFDDRREELSQSIIKLAKRMMSDLALIAEQSGDLLDGIEAIEIPTFSPVALEEDVNGTDEAQDSLPETTEDISVKRSERRQKKVEPISVSDNDGTDENSTTQKIS